MAHTINTNCAVWPALGWGSTNRVVRESPLPDSAAATFATIIPIAHFPTMLSSITASLQPPMLARALSPSPAGICATF